MNHGISLFPLSPRGDLSREISNEMQQASTDRNRFSLIKWLSGVSWIFLLSLSSTSIYAQDQLVSMKYSGFPPGSFENDLPDHKRHIPEAITPGNRRNSNVPVKGQSMIHDRESLQFEGFPRISLYNEFHVSRVDEKVLITWRSAYDSKVDHFEVVRYGENLQNPEIIGILPSKGGSKPNTYEFLDRPDNLLGCHYQLRVTDNKGNQIVIEEKPLDGDDRIQVYPGFTQDEVMLTNVMSIGEPATVTVINCQGKVVRKSVVKNGTPSLAINLADLDDGNYTILIEGKTTRVSSVVTKQ
jgi:hypothetical protein